MDALNQVFIHKPKHRVIVSNHSAIPKQQRRQIVEFVAGLPQIAYTPDRVKYPDINSEAVVGIPVFTDGLRQEPAVNAIQHANTWIEGLHEKFEEAKKEDKSQRSRYEPNPWLEHTGWEKHIGVHKAWVVKQIQDEIVDREIRAMPAESITAGGTPSEGAPAEGEDEEALKKACIGTTVLIRRSFNASHADIVGRHALQCVHRRENGAPTSNRPFYGQQKVQTIRKYTAVFVKILRYIWRTESITARPAYRLTPEQEQALIKLRYAVRTEQEPATSSQSSIRERVVNVIGWSLAILRQVPDPRKPLHPSRNFTLVSYQG
ncbi:hypothetical protein B0A48_18836 [Cryoendolithus antarcticus]|uniref:Uncharacterized protein n=1 Tax=Cryoendolithus antarcticus TaxID=1507870 RepID=A0A1V8S825_9PEZI|nr:hypothetical protein B0A48_18836 [Cryoendolithus antarcticus]